jgi:hypothetical protein
MEGAMGNGRQLVYYYNGDQTKPDARDDFFERPQFQTKEM